VQVPISCGLGNNCPGVCTLEPAYTDQLLLTSKSPTLLSENKAIQSNTP